MKRFFKLVSMFVLAGATLTYTGCTDYDKDIDNLGQEVDALEGKLATLEQQVKNLEALKSQLSDLETKYAGLDKKHGEDVAALEKKIKEAQTALENSLKAYMTTEDAKKTFVMKDGLKQAIIDLGYFAEKTEVTAAKNLAQEALDSAKSALGNVAALKAALGVYAQAGAIQDSLDAKLSIDKFDEAFDAALTEALSNDGKITKAIASAINSAVADFEKLFYGELRSLVFIPDFYVNGIESVEYTYAHGWPVLLTANMDAIKGTEKIGEKYVDFSIPAKQMIETVIDAKNRYDIDPEKVVAYEMNPSSAKIDPERLSFISNDATLLTKAAAAEPVKADYIKVEDGNLYVGMKAIGRKVKMQPETKAKEATMFALQAVVKSEDGKEDITVTSDYANILASVMSFDAIAFANEAHKAENCDVEGKNSHLYPDAVIALEKVPSVQVAWDETIDLAKLVQVHYSVISDVESSKKNHAVYDMEENAYGLSYEFNLIDYLSGTNETSDSQYAKIDGTVLNPCGTTNGTANGKDSELSIGRRPLVQVLVKHGDSVILVGYIKLEIVRTVEYVEADEFTTTAKFGCADNVFVPAWHEFAENIIAKTSYSKEEFETFYELQAGEQYIKNNNDEFVNIKDIKPVVKPVGKVETVTDATVGTTTSVFKWTLTPAEMDAVYKSANHSATIYIRYVRKGAPVTSIHEGIYVPLTVTVTKPAAGTVGIKLSNYWFDNGTKAIINVHVPDANFDVKDWTTDINQVWEGNKPSFNPEEGFASYTDSIFRRQNNAEGGYKYYFSAVQPKGLVAGGKKYDLYTLSNKVQDKFSGKRYEITDNAKIQEYETLYPLDVTVEHCIYTNVELWAMVQGTSHEKGQCIASIEQKTGKITYNNDSEFAKILLNEYPSNPRKDSKLFANIGVVAYTPCKIAYAVTNAVNPYHFLRPIDLAGVTGKVITDGTDPAKPESSLDLYSLLNFNDWRGQSFAQNLSYFDYYQVSNVKVDILNVTTDLSGGNIEKTKLSEKTSLINLSHIVGTTDKTNQSVDVTVDAKVTAATLKSKYGKISYVNNGSTVETEFKLRFPIEVTYAWGTIFTYVDVTVKPTLGNK